MNGSTTQFVYDQDNVILEFNGSAIPSVRYFQGAGTDQMLAQEGAGTVSWMLTDHLGTVRDLVNTSGAVANHFTYDSFGQVLSASGTVDTRYKFTGRELDSETGLYYYRARYYDAGIGRFIGQDPIGFEAGDNNLYRYVGNSPIYSIDPLGTVKIVKSTFTNIGGTSILRLEAEEHKKVYFVWSIDTTKRTKRAKNPGEITYVDLGLRFVSEGGASGTGFRYSAENTFVTDAYYHQFSSDSTHVVAELTGYYRTRGGEYIYEVPANAHYISIELIACSPYSPDMPSGNIANLPTLQA